MFPSGASSAAHRIGRSTALVATFLAWLPVAASAQAGDRDARLPRAGELWVEIAPTFHSWHQQFAANSDLAADGQREPLSVHYDGSLAARLFPGVDPLLDVVNRDAAALGFDPLTAADVSLGNLEFSSIDVFVRRVPLVLQFGVGGFAALEVVAPLVKAEVQAGFAFDSATADLVRAETALADPAGFFGQLDAARTQLQALVDGGTLTSEEEAAAVQLLSEMGAFRTALDGRIAGQEYLFTAASAAGQQMIGTYAGFESGFQGFGVALPALALPATATRSDLDAYLSRDPVAGEPLRDVTRGWKLGELEVGVRFKLLDTSGELPRRTREAAETPDSSRTARPVESGGPDEANEPDEVTVTAGRTEEGSPEAAPGIGLRTSVGARYRFALTRADEDPYLAPEAFLQQPIGDGQSDVELELYQDVALGSRVLIVAGARYGIQLADDLVRRVAPPDRPFALASQQVRVERDLGDYIGVAISPRFAVAETLSLSLEYSYWNKGKDTYTSSEGSVDPTFLTRETGETRHRLGVGAYYRTTRLFAAGRSGFPIELAFRWETAVGGTGGRTAASSQVTASARLPFHPF